MCGVRIASLGSQFRLHWPNGPFQNVPLAFPRCDYRGMKGTVHRFGLSGPNATMFCEILCMAVNDHSTKIAPRQNIKAITRTGGRASDLHENAHQIGIRFFSCTTDDLFLAFNLDVGKVGYVKLPRGSCDCLYLDDRMTAAIVHGDNVVIGNVASKSCCDVAAP